MKDEFKTLVRELKGWTSGMDPEDAAGLYVPAPAQPARTASKKMLLQNVVSALSVPSAEFEPRTAQIIKSAVPPAPARAQEMPLMHDYPQGETALSQIAREVLVCKKCPLGSSRLKAVPGVGSPSASLMFIGEGPGFSEDHKGEPFVGRAGELLNKIIAAMGFRREDVYIANVVKCHPMIDPSDPEKRGNDRPPAPEESAACHDYLVRQIAAIKPNFIIALGLSAAKSLMDSPKASLSSLRGRVHLLPASNFPVGAEIKLVATYHPAALLRNPNWKKDTWEDMKLVMREMGLAVPQQPAR